MGADLMIRAGSVSGGAMHVNNLGGARMPVTTNTATTQTARTSFGTLVQGSAATPAMGRAGLSGSSIIASAISVNSGGVPGFGAPYQQAMPNAPSPTAGATQPQTPPATTGGEFNGELQAQFEQQKALKDLMKMSLMSFISTTFSMGQNRPKPDDW
jgi:hypothetical protein